MTDAGSPLPISTKRYALATANAGSPPAISPYRSQFFFAEIIFQNHRGLGLWYMSLPDLDIAQWMCTCYDTCLQAFAYVAFR